MRQVPGRGVERVAVNDGATTVSHKEVTQRRRTSAAVSETTKKNVLEATKGYRKRSGIQAAPDAGRCAGDGAHRGAEDFIRGMLKEKS